MSIKSTPARGKLAALYTKGDETTQSLARDGWVVLRGLLSSEEALKYRNAANAALKEDGFVGQIDDSTSTVLAKELPLVFWSIDTCVYPLSKWAIQLRMHVRDKFAALLGIDPSTLISSFDGVMIGHSKCLGVGRKARPRRIDPSDSKLPTCELDGGGGAHIDQSRSRAETAESHQMYVPLTTADAQDLSTAFLAPSDGWTVQGIADVLREQFPEFYNPVKKKKIAEYDEGYKFPQEQQNWLLEQKMCTVQKPILNPGDVLIWSSAIPHCGATVESKQPRRARLGLITAFAPAELVPDHIKARRRHIVGGGFATGQQIIYAAKHGCAFPSALSKYTRPTEWPSVYKDLKRKRKEWKTVPMSEERDSDDAETREWRQNIRELLG